MRVGHFLLGLFVTSFLLAGMNQNVAIALLGGAVAMLLGMIAELRREVANQQLDLESLRQLRGHESSSSAQRDRTRHESSSSAQRDRTRHDSSSSATRGDPNQSPAPAASNGAAENPWRVPRRPAVPSNLPEVPLPPLVLPKQADSTPPPAPISAPAPSASAPARSFAEPPITFAQERITTNPPPLQSTLEAPAPEAISSTGYEPKIQHQGRKPLRDPAPSAATGRSATDYPVPDLFEPNGAPSWFASLLSLENWPIKVGVLLLLIGLGSAFKYLVERGYFDVPIELRLASVAAACIGLLVFGYRSVDRRREFGLAMMGGALGALLLTIYAAFRLYDVIEPKTAFILMLMVVSTGVFLAALLDAIWLAVFAAIGGFAAPILASSGSGNFVHLFAYYLVLNLGILALAYIKGWRALNLIGAVATFGIGISWGASYYVPANFASVEPFLIAYFLMYLAIPIFYTRKHGVGEAVLDGVLVFGVPLAALVAQAGLLRGQPEALGISAFVTAAIYAGLWQFLRGDERSKLLRDSFLVLAFGFFTIAIPLYFKASVTSALWAVEGAGLIWLGLRQQRVLPQILGLILQGFAAIAYLQGFAMASAEPLLFNSRLLGALLISVGGMASSLLFDRARQPVIATITWLWGMLWWLAVCGIHIEQSVPGDRFYLAAIIIAVAITQSLATVLQKLLQWPRMAFASLACLLLMPLFAFATAHAFDRHYQTEGFFGNGVGVAMLIYVVSGFACMRALRDPWRASMGVAHGVFIAGLTLLATLWINSQLYGVTIGDGSKTALLMLPSLLLAFTLIQKLDWIAWPIQTQFVSYRDQIAAVAMIGLGFVTIALSMMPGSAAPLPFIPIFNPLELTILAVLALFWLRERHDPSQDRAVWIGALAFWLATTMALRWTAQLLPSISVKTLGAAFVTVQGQATLAIVWSVLGCGAMLVGHIRHKRQLWILGASLMGLVLVKLLLVDRGNLGEMAGIVAMLGVGALLAAVGYFAPAPPSEQDQP